jgi:hypothetical protein
VGLCHYSCTVVILVFRVPMKIFQSPVTKYYIVAALLVNIRTCFYGNQTMEYFKCEAMTLDEYLSLIDQKSLNKNYDTSDQYSLINRLVNIQ